MSVRPTHNAPKTDQASEHNKVLKEQAAKDGQTDQAVGAAAGATNAVGSIVSAIPGLGAVGAGIQIASTVAAGGYQVAKQAGKGNAGGAIAAGVSTVASTVGQVAKADQAATREASHPAKKTLEATNEIKKPA